MGTVDEEIPFLNDRKPLVYNCNIWHLSGNPLWLLSVLRAEGEMVNINQSA